MATRDPRGYRIGTLHGIPLFAAPSWIIIAIVLTVMYAPVLQIRLPELATTHTYLLAATFVTLLFASVLIHEIAHALTARAHNVDVDSVTLWMLGGYTSMRQEPPTPRAEFHISAVGPAASLALAALGWIGYTLTPTNLAITHELLWQLAITNLLLGIFNLLPGLPLDGGSILRSLSWAITHKRSTGTLIAGHTGRILAALLLLAAILTTITTYITNTHLPIASLILTLFVGIFLYNGATNAIRTAHINEQAEQLQLSHITQPITHVPTHTPLSQALQQLHTTPHTQTLITTHNDETPSGILHPHAAAAVPEHRHPWITTGELAHPINPHTLIPPHTTGKQLLDIMRTHPARQYIVCDEHNRPTGIINTDNALRYLQKRPQ